MVDIRLDKSRLVRLFARTGEASVPRTLIFQNEDESAHDISAYNFKLIVYKRANSPVKLFTLSIGSGLTVEGIGSNELLIEITSLQATLEAGVYFWRLYSMAEGHTWLNGPFEFYNGESDNVEREDTVKIYQNA